MEVSGSELHGYCSVHLRISLYLTVLIRNQLNIPSRNVCSVLHDCASGVDFLSWRFYVVL